MKLTDHHKQQIKGYLFSLLDGENQCC